MAEPAVSVVVLNWDRAALLRECLNSLEAQRFRDFEVIVVDQASADGSADLVRRRANPRERLIENPRNLGFAEGCNVGIRAARGRWIALINNDAAADPRWLEELVKAGEARRRTGMVACRILGRTERDRLDNVGVALFPDGMNRGVAHRRRDGGLYEEGLEVFIPSGCACLLRREMLDEIGLFDPAFFAYSEDTDLGLRARLRGWRCTFAARAVVYHRSSATAGKVSAMKIFYAERNRIRLLLRYYPVRYWWLSPAYSVLRYLALVPAAWKMFGGPRSDAPGEGAPRLVWALCRAYAAALVGWRREWAERRRWLASNEEGLELMGGWLRRYRINWADLSSWD